MKKTFYLSLALLVFASCNTENKSTNAKIDFDGVTESIKPGDNFFEHVNKVWLDKAVIADDQVGVGSYSFLNIPQKKLLENILTEVSTTDQKKGSIEQKVGDFYSSGMDVETINNRGFEPIQPILNKIDAISNAASLMSFVTDQLTNGNYSIIGLSVSPDNENSTVNILHFSQAGTGLPDKDYYFRTDDGTKAIQDAYKKYLTTLFTLSKDKNPAVKEGRLPSRYNSI